MTASKRTKQWRVSLTLNAEQMPLGHGSRPLGETNRVILECGDLTYHTVSDQSKCNCFPIGPNEMLESGFEVAEVGLHLSSLVV